MLLRGQLRGSPAALCEGELFLAITKRAEAWCVDLLEHGPEPWLAALRSAEPPDAAAAEVLRVELGYFTTNAPRMDYPAFNSGGLPIGSGAVESAAKHVGATSAEHRSDRLTVARAIVHEQL